MPDLTINTRRAPKFLMKWLGRYIGNLHLPGQVEDLMHTDEMVPAVAKQLLDGLLALKKGDFSVRMPSHLIGIDGKIADCFNEVSELNQRMAEGTKTNTPGGGEEGGVLA